jgi:uncharacterized membrane protein YfcA
MVTLKTYLLSLGPPTPELIKTLVTVLLGCWAWNMLFGRRRWSAKGKVRPLASALQPCPSALYYERRARA